MEHLIQIVQDNPVLYDTSHPDYMRSKLKDEIWKKVAEELHYSNWETAKENWRKLRDCHRDALRRQKKKSGQAATSVRPWLYQNQMEFLVPYMANRGTVTNIMEEVNATTSVANDGGGDDITDTQRNETQGDLGTPLSKKKKKADVSKIILESINSYEERAKKRDILRERSLHQENDALHQFFMSMYLSTKEMPKAYQVLVKKKVFQIVSETEEEILTKSVAPHHSSIPSCSTENSSSTTSISDSPGIEFEPSAPHLL
ncbi:uncharacterized protein LOC126104909 [Schistocerca cancellata]|uniref:uncharacterized protein LOC126104909 n=1 Tax=Schistocerca cancellata TaxID=274614 RepID=UPI0021175DFF|nr:uncharacterized protein LOC126104909 [Schistocerca cancellata]